MKYLLNYNIYAKEFRIMIKEHFTKQKAEAIWKDANRRFVKMKKEHPDAYTSAVKVSYPFACIYMALIKYMKKEEALAMMMDYAPRIGEKIRKIYWGFYFNSGSINADLEEL